MSTLIVLEGSKYSGKSTFIDMVKNAGLDLIPVHRHHFNGDHRIDNVGFRIGQELQVSNFYNCDKNLIVDRSMLSVACYNELKINDPAVTEWFKNLAKWQKAIIVVVLENKEVIWDRSIKEPRDKDWCKEWMDDEVDWFKNSYRSLSVAYPKYIKALGGESLRAMFKAQENDQKLAVKSFLGIA